MSQSRRSPAADHNQYVNDVRRSAREGANVAIEDVAPMLSTQSNAFDSVQLRDLEVAIAKLPPEQRQVILLVGLDGLPYEHVASILQVPIGTVRSRLSRGRDNLRKLMGMVEDETVAPPRSGERLCSPQLDTLPQLRPLT